MIMSSTFMKPLDLHSNFERVSAICHNGDGEIPSMETTMIDTRREVEETLERALKKKANHRRNGSDVKRFSTAKKPSLNNYEREEISWSSSLRKNMSSRVNMLKKISNTSRFTCENVRSPPSIALDHNVPPQKVLENSSSINLSKRESQSMSASDAKSLVQRLFKQDKETNEKVLYEARQKFLDEEKKNCSFSPYINAYALPRGQAGEKVFERLNGQKKGSSKDVQREERASKPYIPKINKRSKSLAKNNYHSKLEKERPAEFEHRLYGVPSQALFKEVWDNINSTPEAKKFFSPERRKPEGDFFGRKYVDKDEKLSFTPKINDSSKVLQRDYKDLYEDAQRRERKRSLSLERKISFSNSFEGHPYHMENTKNLRVNRLIREFKQCAKKYFPDQRLPCLRLGRDCLSNMLIDMNFIIKNKEGNEEILSKIWALLVLSSEGFIKAVDLMNFLLAVMKLPVMSKKNHFLEEFLLEQGSGSEHTNRILEQESVPDPKEQTATFERASHLDEESNENQKAQKRNEMHWKSTEMHVMDINRIAKDFAELYYSKLSYMKKETVAYESFSFQPEICQTSSMIAKQERERITKAIEGSTETLNACLKVEEIMEFKREKSAEKLKQLKQVAESMSLTGCTFKPKLNNQTLKTPEKQQSAGKQNRRERIMQLYVKGKSKNQKRLNRDKGEIEYEQNAHECLFSPNLVKKHSITPTPKDVVSKEAIEKSVERMNKAREEKALKELMLKKGSTYNHRSFGKYAAKKLPKPAISSAPQTFASNPAPVDNLKTKEDEKNETEQSVTPGDNVLLFIDVTLKNGKKKKIVVNEGEEITEVVSRFGLKNGLDEDTMSKLNSMLDQQLELLLSTPEEAL